MSDLSSDEDDFEPSAFHRNIRQQGQNFAYPVYDPNNETGEFSSFEKSNSPITYQSKIPKPVHTNMSPRRDSSPKKTESSAEMKEITQCYHAAQRRIQDLERQLNSLTNEYEGKIKLITHERQMEIHRSQESDEQLLGLRGELEKSESIRHKMAARNESMEREIVNLKIQNEDLQKQILTQEGVIESIQNELRVAHSDDALTKAKFANEKRLEEMRRANDEVVRGLNNDLQKIRRSLEDEKNEREKISAEKRENEKTLNRERIETGETINRLNKLLRDAQQTPLDPVKKKIDFESSEMSTLYASTPREALDASEVKNARSKINTLRRDLDEKNSQLAAIQNELDVTLKEMDILKEENNQLTDQLRSTRDEVQNIGLEFQNFRQNAENERNARIEQKETSLQEHYQKSLAFQIQKEKDDHEVNLLAVRSEIEEKNEAINLLNKSLDRVKEDYCQIAMEKQNLEVKIQTLQDQITISSQNAENCQKSDEFESAKFLAELEKNSKLLEKLEISNSKIEKLEEKLKNQNVCETPRSNHDLNSSKVDQLREKLTHERDSWAKEKRRLESKIRHLLKKQERPSSPTPSYASSQSVTPRETDEAVRRLQIQLDLAKEKYNETLQNIKSDVSKTIDEIKAKHSDRIKREVLLEQKRTSEKLREYYKNILSKLLTSEKPEEALEKILT